MVDVQTEMIIGCSREKVAEYTANPDHAPEWYVNIKSVQWETPKPLGIGSKIAFKANFIGRTLEYVYEIMEYQPLEKLVMRTSNGPFPMETTYEWVSISPDSTLMKLRNRGEPSGFSKFLTPFMKVAMRRANVKDLKKVKDILERHCNDRRK
ncbi:SRPBCC family protein [Marinicrinis lubricantis]|uniref:SRPBCC family protein n=1 Tax=Marinicrinis lubricantis TaxID=2086470 RepID=A0ABW1IR33_9BACL